jgi:hypothetical protein
MKESTKAVRSIGVVNLAVHLSQFMDLWMCRKKKKIKQKRSINQKSQKITKNMALLLVFLKWMIGIMPTLCCVVWEESILQQIWL